jgi:predicted DCC family thiol-disulfide oxidoreductase YuxK
MANLEVQKSFVFYDKSCGFCLYVAKFLKKRTSRLYFFSLQSAFAREFFQKCGLKTPDLEAVCLWRKNKMYRASDAALRVFFFSKIHWRVLAYLGLCVPQFLRDKVYFFIAKRRNCKPCK